MRAWLLCGVLLLLFSLPVAAEGADDVYGQLLEESGAGSLTQALPEDVQALLEQWELDGLSPDTYTDLSLMRVGELAMDLLRNESAAPRGAFGVLLGVILLTALLSGLEVGTATPLRDAYHGVAVLGAGGLLLTPLFGLVEAVGETARQVTVFLTAYVPAYAGILVTGGSPVGALSYQTTLLGATQALTLLIGQVVFPVLTVSLALGCTGAVVEGFCLESISQTLHKTVLWALGLFSTVFSGVLSLQQMVAGAGDSLSGRVIKFSLSGLVPVVGGMLSEAYATVAGGVGLLRTTVGGFGLLVVVLTVTPPLLRCVCWSLCLSVGAAVSSLFGLSPLEKLCRVAGGTVRVLVAVLAVFALLMVVATLAVSSVSGR